MGALVREARLDFGMTQAELGAKIGASRFWVAEFERGKTRAELGLALKALRALRLVLTIEARDVALRREEERNVDRSKTTAQPLVNLSSILNRSTPPTPISWSNMTAPILRSAVWRPFEESKPVEPEEPQQQGKSHKRKRSK